MFSSKDYTLYEGIPKKFITFKNKSFEEWEIAPWNLLIYDEKLIGQGKFGKVYLADWNGTEVVAKLMNKEIEEEKKDLFLKELDVMTKLHHPNIVQILGYVEDPFIIVMEYLPNGELLQYIKQNKFISLKKKINICLDILKALSYLHNRKPNYVIHRDIKPQNILMTPSGRAKITDFGISRIFADRIEGKKLSFEEKNKENIENTVIKNKELTKFVGSVRYMAPEVKNGNLYNEKVDIWSCGIIFSELFENSRYNSEFMYHYTPLSIQTIIKEDMLNLDPFKRKDALSLLNIFKKEKKKLSFFCCF